VGPAQKINQHGPRQVRASDDRNSLPLIQRAEITAQPRKSLHPRNSVGENVTLLLDMAENALDARGFPRRCLVLRYC
jgi:hypothetical protein